jgi:E3 ubiquitin-protein ligase ATL6/9/15/31/42/55
MALRLPSHQLAPLAVLVCAAVAAYDEELSASPPSDNNNTPAGLGIKVPFRPRVAIVVGIFTMIFSLTFLLLMYAKFCHPSSSSSPPQPASNNGAAAAAVCVGLPKQVIESLPFFRFATLRGARHGMECSVCLARFDDADLLRLLPRCRHAFHLACVDRWLQSSATCPLCRSNVDADDAKLDADHALSSGRFDDGAAAEAAGSGRDLLDIFVERVPGPDRHKHRIIVSDVVFKSRWSELNSADLIALDTEMLRSMSSGRFVFPPDSPYCAAPEHKLAAEDQEETTMGNKNKERKRLLEPVVVVDAPLGGECSSGSAVSASAARMISSGVRSMSEIVSLPRLRAAARERLSEEENRRWLPIARRTARWFAGRASGGQEEHRAVHVVAAEHDGV